MNKHRSCDFCKCSWEYTKPVLCISGNAMDTNGDAIKGTAAVWFACESCTQKYSRGHMAGIFTRWLKLSCYASAAEEQVFEVDGMEGSPGEIAGDILNYYKVGMGKVLRKVTQRSRYESGEPSQDREPWFRSRVPLTAFLL